MLFSDKTLVKELLESFVDKGFASEIDFSDYQPLIEKSYISEELKEFAEDLLIKVKLKGKEAYIYLFIEFQSTDDRFMALRLLNYILLFYIDYLKENKNVKYLPPIFPLVLYNGERKWNAPENIRDLIEEHPYLQQFYPDFRYFKIIENEYSRETLLSIGNAVSGIFLLENSNKEGYEKIVEDLKQSLSGESAETIELIAVWIRHLFRNEKVDKHIFQEITSVKNEKEAKSMLVENIERWKQEFIQEGKKEGMKKGKKEGKEEGMKEKAREDAKMMLEDDMPVEKISKYTGLPIEEIKKLKE